MYVHGVGPVMWSTGIYDAYWTLKRGLIVVHTEEPVVVWVLVVNCGPGVAATLPVVSSEFVPEGERFASLLNLFTFRNEGTLVDSALVFAGAVANEEL